MKAFKILVIVLAVGGFVPTARAATNIVTSLADNGAGTLRQVIAGSAAGDTITFAVTGSIALTNGELVIGTDLTILGPGQTNLTVDGRQRSRLFNIAVSNALVNISNLTISNGYCAGAGGVYSGGGAAYGGGIINCGTLSLAGCTIVGNAASGGWAFSGSGGSGLGGGVCNYGTLNLSRCTISFNSARGGDTHTSGAGSGRGGGVCNYRTLSLTECTLSNNWAGGGSALIGPSGSASGGAVDNEGTSSLTGCTLSYNQAVGGGGLSGGGMAFGGGLASYGAVTMTNCTVTGNGADSGSGLYLSGSSTNLVVSCTISSNYAGFGLYAPGPHLMIMNTLVAGNNGSDDVYGSVVSLGYNLIGQTNYSFGWVASDLAGCSNALLGPLQDNGGQTLTMALQPGSTAINNGTSFGVVTDQRGLPRPVVLPAYPVASGGDGTDVGAFEVQPLVPPPLCVSHSGNAVTVYWQAVAGWSLQQNSNLLNPNGWSAIGGVTNASGTNYLNLLNPSDNLFFRLQ